MATKKKAAPRKRSVKPKPPAEEPRWDRRDVVHPTTPVAVPADGTLLRADGDPVVYVMDGGQRRPFTDLEAFHTCCGGGATITVLPPKEIDPIPQGSEVGGPADLK